MKRLTIRVEIDDARRPISRADLMYALVEAAPQIKSAIQASLPDAHNVSREVFLLVDMEEDR